MVFIPLQVVCPLPKLAIHDPDQITNLDFKENTDHTRSDLLHLSFVCNKQ